MMYGAYLCVTQGHILTGQGWGTGPGQTVWASHCARCGAKVGDLPTWRHEITWPDDVDAHLTPGGST